MLWLIKRNFKDIGREAFLLLDKHLVRSYLENCNSGHRTKNLTLTNSRRCKKGLLKWFPNFKKCTTLTDLSIWICPLLTYRRSRGHMIETYKLLTGKYDQQLALTLPTNVTGDCFTGGNCNKLFVKRCRYELRKNFFSNRIVNMWNRLPDYVVISDTINTLKNRLDAHWKHRIFLFHYRATYTGTED